MKRRRLLTGAAAALALPSIGRAEAASTLKFIPYADLALLDPMVAAFVTRNHVMMVFDTLFALDADGVPQPQMLEGYNVSADGKLWLMTLRDGLVFHDGTPVLGRDVVASIRRWWTGDAYGQAVAAATDEISAPTDKTVQFRLKRKFELLPFALAHPTNLVAAIMPERLAQTPPTVRLKEIVGSGPYRYLDGERVAGARNVYAKFDKYTPRPQGTPDFCAGPRIAHFERVEWLTTPDPATQVSALQSGEVDWVEQPLMDLVGQLRADKSIKLQVAETKGLIGFLRLNQLFPPFDNPAIRRVVLQAVNQKDFMEAVVGNNSKYDAHVGVFAPGSAMASDAGMEALSGQHSLATLKQQLAQAGYNGEKIVYLAVNDVPRINAIAEVGADMLRKLGMNVDEVAADWGTVVQRSVSRQALDKGGWSVFASFSGGYDTSDPAINNLLRGNGADAYNGWPDSPALETLRNQWLAADDLPTRKALAQKIQVQAFQDVPFLPLGSYYQPTAYRANLTDMLTGLILFTNVRRV